jgi:hypothetical protein
MPATGKAKILAAKNAQINAFQWDATGKDHDAAVIGNVNSEELPTQLRMLREIPGRDIEGAGGNALLIDMSMLPIQPHPCGHGK